MKRMAVVAIAILLGLAPIAGAQTATGNIYGNVTDEQGLVLPGASVSLTATTFGGQPRTTVTGEQGDFRFLSLDPGNYKLSVALQGFATTERNLIVNSGGNVNVSFPMKITQQSETITVTADTPLIDTKKVGTATTLTKEELSQTPQSRDPWAILKTVPGIIVDRVNVGGNESGQQSGFAGKGAAFADTMWSYDGVIITDTTSGGASSSYFDFDAFDEINVKTGGNDITTQTGGIGINFVTRRGTNQFKGSVRGYFNNDALESSNTPDELVGDERLQGAEKANHTDQIWDWGAEIGGPIVKDKLWFWASYGKNDIRIVRLNQTFDQTILKNKNAKVNWQISQKDNFSFSYFDGAKEKLGRSPGQAGTEEDSFLWNQGNFYPGGLHGLYKWEDNHVFGSNFVLNGKYAYYGWGYGFAPRGGADQDGGIDSDNDHAYGSWFTFQARKPWHIANVSANYFKGSHEVKFGFDYRRNPNNTFTTWSGSQVIGAHLAPGNEIARVYRERQVKFLGQNTDIYVQDTWTHGALTANFGVRWDKQTSKNLPSVAAANPTFPELLPALTYDGAGPSIDWTDISPRVSMTYALGADKKTLVRASYARYAGQLNPFEVTASSPVGVYYTFVALRWVDTNGDHFAQKSEILNNLGVLYANAVDPRNPASASSVNTIDPDYGSNHDNEIIVGLDHELAPNLSVGGSYTWHRSDNVTTWSPRIGLTAADYSISDAATVTVDGQTYSAIAYAPNAGPLAASNGGRILSNRPDYNTSYNGFEMNLVKRLSGKWMARASFSYMDWTESLNGSGAVQNPTRSDSSNSPFFGAGTLSGAQVDGGQIAPRSGGSGKGDIFYNAKWQFNMNGLYQVGKGFEVAGSFFGRQGYVRPFFIQLDGVDDGTIRVLATSNIDDNRYPDLWVLDMRVLQNIKVGGKASVALSADLFNALNSNTDLSRVRRLNSAAFDTLNEVISPRILRIGVRLQF